MPVAVGGKGVGVDEPPLPLSSPVQSPSRRSPRPCPKPFTGVEEHCLEKSLRVGADYWFGDEKLIMDLIWFKMKKQQKRERVCIV